MRIIDIEEFAVKHNVPIMNKEGIDFLTEYIKNNNIKKVLEIGTAIGYSAIKMALVSSDIKITSIETDFNRYQQAINNINHMNLSKQITLIRGDALEVNVNDKYDLIFIDAAKSQYINFFDKYKHSLNDSGVIVSDNLSFHGLVEDPTKTNNRNTKQLVAKIQKYIDFLKFNEEFDTTFYKIGDGISVSKKRE